MDGSMVRDLFKVLLFLVIAAMVFSALAGFIAGRGL